MIKEYTPYTKKLLATWNRKKMTVYS